MVENKQQIINKNHELPEWILILRQAYEEYLRNKSKSKKNGGIIH